MELQDHNIEQKNRQTPTIPPKGKKENKNIIHIPFKLTGEAVIPKTVGLFSFGVV